MHNGVYTFSSCRFMNMISVLWDMHEKICTLIYLHVMQLRLPSGITLIVKAVGLTSCWQCLKLLEVVTSPFRRARG